MAADLRRLYLSTTDAAADHFDAAADRSGPGKKRFVLPLMLPASRLSGISQKSVEG